MSHQIDKQYSAKCNRIEHLSQKMMLFTALRQDGALTMRPQSMRKLFDGAAASCAETLLVPS